MAADSVLSHCLVTGASGFLGRPLCGELQRRHIKVRALLRQPQEGPWQETVIGDLSAVLDQSQKLFDGIDTVFHLAAIAHCDAPQQDYETINHQQALRLAEAALSAGVRRFVYVSSVKAGEPDGDPYALSKYHTEQDLLALSGWEHLAIVRPCLIYGVGVKGNLLSMLAGIDRGYFPPLPCNGAMRSLVFVGDVVSALILVANSARAHRKIYTLSDSTPYAVKDIELAMRQQLGKSIPGWHLPAWCFRLLGEQGNKLIASAIYSSALIRDELGWQSADAFYRVLPELVNHYRNEKIKGKN